MHREIPVSLWILLAAFFGCEPQTSDVYNNTEESRNCICMMCRGGHDGNLYKGKCWFGGEDPYSRYYVDNPHARFTQNLVGDWLEYYRNPTRKVWHGAHLHYFMYGFGPTFADFEIANRYCKNKLTLVTNILTGTNFNAPTPPPPEITQCYLTAGVIPVYVYYTQGLQTSPFAMRRFIRKMQGWPTWEEDSSFVPDEDKELGPVVVTPEFRYDDKDQDAVNAVKGQIDVLFLDCKKCMVALAPRQYDTVEEKMNALDAVLLDSGGMPNEYADKVDIIGQEMLFSPDKNCDFYKQFDEALDFSRQVVRKYAKPVVWLLFGISDSARPDGSCKWTRKDVAEYYKYVFSNTEEMVSSGIIGAVQNGIMDHIPIKLRDGDASCRFGLLDTLEQRKQPIFESWFNACQFYYAVSDRVVESPVESGGKTLVMKLSNVVPIVYPFEAVPGKSYAPCAFNPRTYALSDSNMLFEGQEISDVDPEYYCEMCLLPLTNYWLSKYPKLRDLAAAIRPFEANLSQTYSESIDAVSCEHLAITMHLEAVKCGLDPMLIRAIIWEKLGKEALMLLMDQAAGLVDTVEVQLPSGDKYDLQTLRRDVYTISSRMCNYLGNDWFDTEEMATHDWVCDPIKYPIFDDYFGISGDPAFIYDKWLQVFLSLVQYDIGTEGLTALFNEWIEMRGRIEPYDNQRFTNQEYPYRNKDKRSVNNNFFDFVCNCNSDGNGDGKPDNAPFACAILARYFYLIRECNTLCYQCYASPEE